MNCQLLIVVAIVGIATAPLQAQSRAAGPQRIDVCTLVSKEEVKKHLPWIAALDRMPIVEEPIGADGSSCEFPTVGVQVLPFSRAFLDVARKSAPMEPLAGLGDEAYFRNNQNRFAEVLVRVGPRLLTLQASAEGKVDTIKARVIDLARVYVAKLR